MRNDYADRTMWTENNELHRLDGPAVEYNNGLKEYWVDGRLHRTDGPAIVCKNGDTEYYIEGKLHRIDGPAIDWSDQKRYFINGEQLTEKEFNMYNFVRKL